MKNFNTTDSSRGPRKFDSNKPRFSSRDSGGAHQMHDATCAECGGNCRVPFMPTSGKPVYCSNCFEKRGNGNDRPNKRSFAPRNDRGQDSYHKPAENFSKQFDALNKKLDAVLALLAKKAETAPAITETAEKAPKVKKVAKAKAVELT